MKRLPWPRRVLWLGLGLVVGGLVATATVAVAGLQPADLTFTPNSEAQMTNIDVGRAWAKNYYGAPTATSGPGGTWDTPLNLQSNYSNEARSVAQSGQNWLHARSHVPDRAIVLDVDDTTLTTWNYELYSNWDFNPTTNAQFVGLTGGTFTGNMFPATPGMVNLANRATALGYAIFWITGRGDSQHAATIANLVNDTAAGLPNIDTVTLNGQTIPEVDAVTSCPRRSTPATAALPTACSPSRRSARTRLTSTRPSFAGRSSTRGGRVQPFSTSPGRAPTSSRRATTSSPTSATSSAISRAASRTRRSRCRTRTTTSRRRGSE